MEKKQEKRKKYKKRRRRRGKGRGRAASCKSSWNNWILGGDELESELSFLRLFVQSPRWNICSRDGTVEETSKPNQEISRTWKLFSNETLCERIIITSLTIHPKIDNRIKFLRRIFFHLLIFRQFRGSRNWLGSIFNF